MGSKLAVTRDMAVSGVAINESSFTLAGGAVYTDAVEISRNVGFISLFARTHNLGGDINLWPEYSIDGENWSRSYVTPSILDNTNTLEGDIVQNLTQISTLRHFVFPARFAKFVRIGILPNANSDVTLKMCHQEEL